MPKNFSSSTQVYAIDQQKYMDSYSNCSFQQLVHNLKVQKHSYDNADRNYDNADIAIVHFRKRILLKL